MIKELNKFSEQLTAYRNNGALPQGEVKNALVDIYEANWPNNKRWGSSTINRGCPSCISDMMKSLCAEFEKGLKKHTFPKKEVETLNKLQEDSKSILQAIRNSDKTDRDWETSINS